MRPWYCGAYGRTCKRKLARNFTLEPFVTRDRYTNCSTSPVNYGFCSKQLPRFCDSFCYNSTITNKQTLFRLLHQDTHRSFVYVNYESQSKFGECVESKQNQTTVAAAVACCSHISMLSSDEALETCAQYIYGSWFETSAKNINFI